MTGPNKPPPPSTIPGQKASGHDLRQLQTHVAKLLGRDSTRFPGAQPVSFTGKHLQELLERDYYVCEKSDGIRCLMYLTSNTEHQEMVFLIDRKNDYYLVPELHFPRMEDVAAFHVDTIVDGELVNDLEKDGSVTMKYLVFDCMVLDGQPLLDRILDKRLGYFRERVHKPFVRCFEEFPEDRAHLPFYVDFKHMERSYGLQVVFDEILPNLPHGNDGLIFTNRNTPYHPGTDPNIVKWKPPDENSIDFRLYLQFPPLSPSSSDEESSSTNGVITPHHELPALDYAAFPTFHLAVGMNNGQEARFSTMYASSADLTQIKSLGRPLDEAVIECYQDSEHRWRFMRVRDDKLEPNHISTVERVMESISDRITKEQLTASTKNIRMQWKLREKEEMDREKAIAKARGAATAAAGTQNGKQEH
ncbi:MAG: hypothetical protein GOMPHAMPRED_003160 [Gomphillus americanus]|uniref:mRNA-capping enzyme subunit alpha n=1 Tax=Gomphillus americanus TaxID=1940652 RepID=A0A8H3I6R7_9LECA|nr:MAG: hypothetical protein GOMPHAMPRED_003160 [Gomphillus americanus]